MQVNNFCLKLILFSNFVKKFITIKTMKTKNKDF